MDTAKRRVAVLGAGKVACHHADAAHALGHAIVAGATRSPSSHNWTAFHARAPEARFVPDGAALLHDPAVDAVIVCLPWNVIENWLDRLLESPTPLLIEKPVGLTAAKLQAALELHGAHRDNRLIGYNRRFYTTVARLRERLAAGGLKAVQATISEDIAHHVSRHGPEVVEHLLAFSSAHFLDLLLHLLGDLAIVRLRAHREREPGVPFVSYNGLLETATGIPVSLSLNASDPSPAGLRLLFDDHTTWVLQPLERLRVYDRYEIEGGPASTLRTYKPHEALAVDEPVGVKPGFVRQLESFLSGEFGPGARLQDQLNVLRFIERIRAAA